MGFMYKGQKIPTGGGSSQVIYSTEEQRIGTWIDGKPLYRKTYQLTVSFSTNEAKTVIDADFTNRSFKFAYGALYSPRSWNEVQDYQLPLSISGGTYFCFIEVNNGKLVCATKWDSIVSMTLECSVAYTKTTDQATSETQLLNDMDFDIAPQETAATASIILEEV